MDRRDADALDRHITGNYGEDQYPDEIDEERAASLLDEAVDGFVDSNRRLFEEYVRGWHTDDEAEAILNRTRWYKQEESLP